MKIDFECPKCNGIIIEEVIVRATISTPVVEIDKDGGGLYDRSNIECDDGYVERYQCKKCGFILVKDSDVAGELDLTDLEEELKDPLKNLKVVQNDKS